MKKAFLFLCIISLTIGITPSAMADIIDFETGFSDTQSVGTVNTLTNDVTFSVGMSPATSSDAFIAAVGAPMTAFVSNDEPAGVDAEFFLTDEIANGQFPTATLNYYMVFGSPILDLNLDLYDYRVDGGPAVGDEATLTVYQSSDFDGLSDFFTFTIPSPNPGDGNVETLSVSSFAFLAQSASVTFGGSGPQGGSDVGTGIDNIAFTTVPEPATMILLGSGLLGLAAYGRKKFIKK